MSVWLNRSTEMLFHKIVYSFHSVPPVWCRYWPLVLSLALQVKNGSTMIVKVENLSLSYFSSFILYSMQVSHFFVLYSLHPHALQHARPPCPSPTPGVHSNPCPLSRWCHATISSAVFPSSSLLQSFPESGSFQMSQLFVSDGQSIGILASTSVLPMNTQDWSPLGWTGWISLQSKGLSRVFSNTTVQKHQFFGA